MDYKQYLENMRNKAAVTIEKGERFLNNISKLSTNKQSEKIALEIIESTMLDDKVQKRRYGIKQAAEMVGVAHSSIYAAEKDGRLPPPEYREDTVKTVRAGYTINQINQMRDVFDTRPSKPDGVLAAIIGFLNLKGGSHKTTNCQQFGQALAISGYRVLLVDTDPQASLSFLFGKKPDRDVRYENTIAPFLLEDEEALIEAGFPEGSSATLEYAIQNTYWDDIDIIPACLQNLNIDLLLPKMMNESDLSLHDGIMRLRNGLLDIGNEYDFIIIDGTPSLNMSTLNVVSACDMVFVPTPASMPDYASTLQFVSMLDEAMGTYIKEEPYPNIPDLRFFITKFSRSSYAQFMGKIIRKVFQQERGDVLTNEAMHSDEIGKASSSIYSIYEVNPSESDNRKKLKQTIESFDRLYEEMLNSIIETCYSEFEEADEIDKMVDILED